MADGIVLHKGLCLKILNSGRNKNETQVDWYPNYSERREVEKYFRINSDANSKTPTDASRGGDTL